MAYVVVFHSMLGLRPVERRAAEHLRHAGHDVSVPDLYEGRTAETMGEGYALMGEVGWPTITRRANDAVQEVPANAVLLGFSMGVGVVGALLSERTRASAVVLLHALTALPANVRRGLPLQVHVGSNDAFAPMAEIAALSASASQAGVDARIFAYPGAGHFYTDAAIPEHDAHAANLTWQRILALLHALPH